MSGEDPLQRLLTLAEAEGLLSGGLERLLRGLRERAALILAERIVPLEEKAAALERENPWLRETIANLERRAQALENAKRETTVAFERETAWLRETIAALEQLDGARAAEIERVRADRNAASTAHDRLLEHHRHVLRDAIDALAEVDSWLPWRARRAKRRVVALLELLRRELQ